MTFQAIIDFANLPIKGALRDDDLEILDNGGLYVKNGLIEEVGNWGVLHQMLSPDIQRVAIDENSICLPSYIDCHTHIAFGGNRANDFAMRNAGRSYLEIAESGGGIWSTVQHTRACSQEEQEELILERAYQLLQQGITTIEVKVVMD
jgi:imidazolonepropionase